MYGDFHPCHNITFETDHFSVYAVTKCTKEKETVTTDTETTEPEKPVESETPTEKPTQKPVETIKPTEKPTTTPTETEGPAEGSIFTYTKLNNFDDNSKLKVGCQYFISQENQRIFID